jgi:hypothetical protein
MSSRKASRLVLSSSKDELLLLNLTSIASLILQASKKLSLGILDLGLVVLLPDHISIVPLPNLDYLNCLDLLPR